MVLEEKVLTHTVHIEFNLVGHILCVCVCVYFDLSNGDKSFGGFTQFFEYFSLPVCFIQKPTIFVSYLLKNLSCKY